MHTITNMRVYVCRCERCGHEWRSTALPDRCPRNDCRSRAWDSPEPIPAGRPRKTA